MAKIENTFTDHIFYKRILTKEILKGEELIRTIENLSQNIQYQMENLENSESKKLTKEKAEYLQNVINLSEEVRLFNLVRQLL